MGHDYTGHNYIVHNYRSEEQNFYFVEQVLLHAQWSNSDGDGGGGTGVLFLRRMWPSVKRAMEQAGAY